MKKTSDGEMMLRHQGVIKSLWIMYMCVKSLYCLASRWHQIYFQQLKNTAIGGTETK